MCNTYHLYSVSECKLTTRWLLFDSITNQQQYLVFNLNQKPLLKITFPKHIFFFLFRMMSLDEKLGFVRFTHSIEAYVADFFNWYFQSLYTLVCYFKLCLQFSSLMIVKVSKWFGFIRRKFLIFFYKLDRDLSLSYKYLWSQYSSHRFVNIFFFEQHTHTHTNKKKTKTNFVNKKKLFIFMFLFSFLIIFFTHTFHTFAFYF